MGWKGKESDPTIHERLLKCSSLKRKVCRAPKGYVPILVGKGAMVERFLVHVKLFSDPCMVVLLEMTAHELGFGQEGILRIPCDTNHFRQVVSAISKAK